MRELATQHSFRRGASTPRVAGHQIDLRAVVDDGPRSPPTKERNTSAATTVRRRRDRVFLASSIFVRPARRALGRPAVARFKINWFN